MSASAHRALADTLAQYDATLALFAGQVVDAGRAEATYRGSRAARVLRAQGDGVKSIAAAEHTADADPVIRDLLTSRLVTAAVADSSKQRLIYLRERVGALRSVLADSREADRQHAMSGGQHA